RGLERYRNGRFAVKIVTRDGAVRIARFACELALRRKLRGRAGKVTCVTKSNVLPQTDGLFHQTVEETVRTYPDLTFEHFHVDDAARRIVRFPSTLDVVLCMNQYGDILSDVAGEVAGGLGVAPSGNFGDNGWAYFESVHVSLATRWLDPADTDAEITPFMIFYALHDALVKPMPGGLNTPSLAESWTMSPDGRTWDFVLRKGTRFHNGDPVTAEDVKFSFERYKGVASSILKDRVRKIQVVDAGRVRFHLKDPWPDFMTFYGTSASGAAWIVPKKYVEQVGEDGFKKAPIGAGPYKFVSFAPGIELVLEAFDGYWRKTPSVKRLVLRSIPDESTRAAALKRGEVDAVYFLNGPIAEDVRRTPGLTLTAMR